MTAKVSRLAFILIWLAISVAMIWMKHAGAMDCSWFVALFPLFAGCLLLAGLALLYAIAVVISVLEKRARRRP